MQKYLNNIWKKLNTKGHERITFMVIPHGEANIISIQLSKFTIFFGVFITLTIIAASIISTKIQGSIQPEVNQLFDTNKSFYFEREHYVDKFNKIKNHNELIKEEIIKLYKNITISDQNPIFLSHEKLRELADDELDNESIMFAKRMEELVELMKDSGEKMEFKNSEDALVNEYIKVYDELNTFKYSSEVTAYRQLHLDIKQVERVLSAFAEFVEEREGVQQSLPYFWPVAGGHFTSFFGPRFSPFGHSSEFHLGVDLADRPGTPVYAAAEGIVVRSNYLTGYGNNIVIKHKYGYTTTYAHLQKRYIRKGQYIRKGTTIGTVGATGRATGPHLHFEVRIQGKHVNPLPYLTTL